MKERLILNEKFFVRGWKNLPYAIYDNVKKQATFLNKPQFDLVLNCSGKKEIDSGELDAPLQTFLDDIKKKEIVRPAEEGETRNLYYRFYDNMYKQDVHWSITGKCNYKCRHCFQSAPNGRLMQPTLQQCKDIIRQFVECGVGSVGITGGEPLTHPDFLAIVDELIDSDIQINVIYTNGKLVTQGLLDELLKRGIRPAFQLSFDGVGYHDWMRGVSGAEKAAYEAFRLLRENGFPTSASMCLCRENIGSLRETVKVLAEAGCLALKTQCAVPQGLWTDQKEHFLTHDELLVAYLDYIEMYAEDKMPLALQMEGFFHYDPIKQEYAFVADKTLPADSEFGYAAMPVCEVVHKGFYLGPGGDVVPCMSIDSVELNSQFPNIYEMPLKQILSESFFTDIMSKRVKDVIEHNPECTDCEHRIRCCGGCRGTALVDHQSDYLAADGLACKMFKEHWDEKLYAVADRYFNRRKPAVDSIHT